MRAVRRNLAHSPLSLQPPSLAKVVLWFCLQRQLWFWNYPASSSSSSSMWPLGVGQGHFFLRNESVSEHKSSKHTQNAKFSCKNVSCNRRNLEPAWQPGSCYKMKSELQLVSTWHQSSSEKVKNLSSHPDVLSAWCQTSWCFQLSRCLEPGRFQTWNLLHPKSGYS